MIFATSASEMGLFCELMWTNILRGVVTIKVNQPFLEGGDILLFLDRVQHSHADDCTR